jgi:hypothetical protein
MKFLKKFESEISHESMNRDEMCAYLCKCGYDQEELDACPDHELEMMCRKESQDNNMQFEKKSEKSKDKWISSAIKRPGDLRKKMKKEEGEKISKSEIKDELDKLKAKDKDKSKKGVQGLSKKDLKNFRQLNLAKTLKGLKEHQEQEHYMFFANLENIHRMCEEILQMDPNEIDHILSDGHGWAVDHIATSKDDVEEVFGFLKTHSEKPSHFDSMNNPHFDTEEMKTESKSVVKNFKNFK